MKRKTQRVWRKKWVAFFAPLSAIIALIALLFNQLKETVIPTVVGLIKSWFVLDDKSNVPFIILSCVTLFTITLLSLLISKLYLNINRPSRKYFELIDFKKLTDDVIRNAAEGILNSEKTQPFFVHVAPVNDEIKEFFKKLDLDGFVWGNGKPGEGKSMLAYNALFRFRKKIGFTYGQFPVVLFKIKYRSYKLILNNTSDEKEINSILEELDSLKGGERKIILVDDAHKLSFENKLRWEFEEEAKDRINGKIVWINTNYLDYAQSNTKSLNISFEAFYPKLLNDLYNSQNPVIKDVIENKCSALQEAIKLKEKNRIRDPWHFNFVATKGEERIGQFLDKLSDNKVKQDALLLSIFLFSCRNILTGEKEIYQTEFVDILSSIEIPYFKNAIATYGPNTIISDLGSQDKGRFLIIEDRNSMDRGLLRASHFKLSQALIKSIIARFANENLIKQILKASSFFLTTNFSDSKYFEIYFRALGNYEGHFLSENRDWVKEYLTNLELNQLYVYPTLLDRLKRRHNSFYKGLTTDNYFVTIASVISDVPANRFKAIQEFVRVLAKDKEKLLKKLNLETLANTANKAGAAQINQVAEFINALRNTEEQKKFIKKISLETLANTANKAGAAQINQVAEFINALRNTEEQKKFIKKISLETLANTVNKADAAQLKQVADFINALRNTEEQKKFIKKISLETLANTANKAGAAQINQVAEFINALRNTEEQKKFIKKISLETLANTANKAGAAQLKQVADFITALRNTEEQKEFIEKLNWEALANTLNKADAAQLKQIADFITALGNYGENISVFLKEENIILYSTQITWKQIHSFCVAIGSIEPERKNSLICKCDWIDLLSRIQLNHSEDIKSLSYILSYQNKKQEIQNQPVKNRKIDVYLNTNRQKIVHFSTQFFISPDDFLSCSNLLAGLLPHSREICLEIAGKIKYKVIRHFSISPKYYYGFANLLDTIHQIDPKFSKYILANNSVKSLLFASFKDSNIKEQKAGLKKLLDFLEKTAPSLLQSIMRNQTIINLGIELSEIDLTEEDVGADNVRG